MVRDLNVGRSRIGPLKADAPFVIDADAVLPRSVASQCLQAIAWWRPQVIEFHCCLNHCEFAGGGTLDPTELLRLASLKQSLRVPTLEALN
jgi:hypothetical protein